jgi:two-component system sensor histidine kinase TctE
MHFTESLRKSSESKLLPFRSPASRGLDPRGLDLGPDQLPHDVAMLRRPEVVDSTSAPQLKEQDGLAHDARNLVASLELFSGLLAEPGVLGEEHKHFAGDLKSLTAPLASLVEQMAAASRSQAGGAGMNQEPMFAREPLRPSLASGRSRHDQQQEEQRDAGMMVKSCERLLGAIAGPAVALHISCERGLGEPSLSGEALTRVLVNLVQNASEAMPQGGRVVITVRKALGARPSALVTVQDTGLGIPAHAIGQVFQAGFSSKKAEKKWPATRHYGLGLTIVRDLVEGAGGSVRVASTLKKGTTFEIKLPCRRA